MEKGESDAGNSNQVFLAQLFAQNRNERDKAILYIAFGGIGFDCNAFLSNRWLFDEYILMLSLLSFFVSIVGVFLVFNLNSKYIECLSKAGNCKKISDKLDFLDRLNQRTTFLGAMLCFVSIAWFFRGELFN